jgi:chromosome partitioning protein
MTTIISLANQKGGVGKTTSTINLGAAMAELGRRVLLVDFDPQGAATVGVGFNPNELTETVYNVLLDRAVEPRSVVLKSAKANVDLLPANIDLAAAEVVLVSEVAREQALRRALEPILDDYDFVLVDCPPSLGLLTVNALTASDAVIIPMECEFFALRGMALLVDTIEKVRERLNPRLRVQGILATMFDGRTLHSREVLERVKDAFGDLLFRTQISRTIRFAEAPVAGEAILTYAPDSSGSAQYRALAKEVLGIDDQESEPTEGGRALPADLDAVQLDLGGGRVAIDRSSPESGGRSILRLDDERSGAEHSGDDSRGDAESTAGDTRASTGDANGDESASRFVDTTTES